MLTKNDTPTCVTLSMALHAVPLIVLCFNDCSDIYFRLYISKYFYFYRINIVCSEEGGVVVGFTYDSHWFILLDESIYGMSNGVLLYYKLTQWFFQLLLIIVLFWGFCKGNAKSYADYR